MALFTTTLARVAPLRCRAEAWDESPQTPRQAFTLADAWRRHEVRLRRLVAGLGIGAAHADDVMQEVYLTASREHGFSGDEEHARRWLLRVAINRCQLEHRRRRVWMAARRAIARAWPTAARPVSPLDRLVASEELAAMTRALDELDFDLRTALVLRYFMDLDSSQIADILETSSSTVRGRLRLARRRLAERLEQMGFDRDE